MENSIPKYNELTQCVKEDGKGGYKVIPMPIAKEVTAEEVHDPVEQVMRPTEVRVNEILDVLKEENAQLKAELDALKGA